MNIDSKSWNKESDVNLHPEDSQMTTLSKKQQFA